MPWVRFDDLFPIHRKIDGLSDRAFRLHVSAIFWCVRNGTDGFIPEGDIDLVCPRVRPPGRYVDECLKRRTWHKAGDGCASEKCLAPAADRGSGWVVHDLLDYQPSARQVAEDRLAKADRQRRWLDKRRGKEPSRDASQDASEDDAPHPSPPRPEGKRGADAPQRAADGRPNPPGPAANGTKPKPPWCGECDELTRQVNPDKPARCLRCHPLASLESP